MTKSEVQRKLMNLSFENKVALVTGAASGMGLATAQAFAEAGAAVGLADVNEDAVRLVTEDLRARGHRVLGITCDVSDEDQVAAMVDKTVAAFGRLDMAFNNMATRSTVLHAISRHPLTPGTERVGRAVPRPLETPMRA